MSSYEAVVEVPKGSCAIYDLERDGTLVFDRWSHHPFPADYGSILDTLAPDGDRVDVIIIASSALALGEAVQVRPIAVLNMDDRDEADDKVVAVVSGDAALEGVLSMDDSHGLTAQCIEDFLYTVKSAAGHAISFNGWGGPEAAESLILAAKERHLARA